MPGGYSLVTWAWMLPKKPSEIPSKGLYQMDRAGLQTVCFPGVWGRLFLTRSAPCLFGTLRRKREGNEWTQLWIPQPPSLPIRLYILLHACKCKSVISLSQSFLINVFFYFLKRWRTRLPISLAWHPGRLFKIQGQPAFPVPSAPAPYRAVLPACGPSFGCPEHLSCCCLEWPFLPQCPTVLVFVSFQNPVHVAPFLLCLFIRAHLQLSSLKLNWRNCCK